jgi:hypothetical protein
MSLTMPAQAGAQLFSLIVLGLMARWYAAPWLMRRSRADALTAILWVQVFRYVALQVFSAQRDGFPISDAAAADVVIGDVAGAGMALAAILLLRFRQPLAIPLAWLLAAETAYDTVTNISDGVREHLMGAAGGVTWLTLAFFVPAVVVGIVLLTWQLWVRRGQAFDSLPPKARQERNDETSASAHRHA